MIYVKGPDPVPDMYDNRQLKGKKDKRHPQMSFIDSLFDKVVNDQRQKSDGNILLVKFLVS